MASCTRIDGMVQAYVDGELSPSDRVILEQHVGSCTQCAELVRSHRRLSAELFETFAEYRLCRDLRAPVVENLPEMELQPADLAGVNFRAKHAPGGWATAARFLPAAAIVVVVALGLTIKHYWPASNATVDALGVVLLSMGDARNVADESTSWNNTHAQQTILPGDRFKTGPESSLVLGMRGPTLLKVNGDSQLKIDTQRRISLEHGEIWLDIGRDGQLFRVTTPDGTITVFGTAFAVRVKDGATTVSVERGEVLVGNQARFTHLRQGEQVRMSMETGLSRTERVNPDEVAGWAKALVADEHAEAAFQKLVLSNSPNTELPAQAVFFVDLSMGGKKWAVRSINVYWEPDAHTNGHCSYDVFVCDDQMNPLFMDRVPASMLNDQAVNVAELPLPQAPLANARWLFVRLLPDMTTGSREAKGLSIRASAAQR